MDFYITNTQKDIPLPEYKSTGAAGMDLYSSEDATLEAGKIKLVATGIKIALPQGYEAQLRPRSGLALSNGISLVNTPGTIDSDYRGEIKLIMINFGEEAYNIKRGDRIAQMVINRVETVKWTYVDELPKSERDENGFGHTGK